MIKLITSADRKKSPTRTKGKKYKLISKSSGRVLCYGNKTELKKCERRVQFFKHQ